MDNCISSLWSKNKHITLSLINVNKKRAQNAGIQKHLSPLHCPAATSETITQNAGIQKHLSPLHCPAATSETITQNAGIQKHLSPLHCPSAASETISHKTQVYRNISRPFTVLQPQVKQSLNMLQSLVMCWHCYSTWSIRQYIYIYTCATIVSILSSFCPQKHWPPVSKKWCLCLCDCSCYWRALWPPIWCGRWAQHKHLLLSLYWEQWLGTCYNSVTSSWRVTPKP